MTVETTDVVKVFLTYKGEIGSSRQFDSAKLEPLGIYLSIAISAAHQCPCGHSQGNADKCRR